MSQKHEKNGDNMFDLSFFFNVTSHETWFSTVPKDEHMEDMSAPCKQMMCWQCPEGNFHVEFAADVGDT